ncbi:hypothetical protein MUU47_00370 [Scandinavium sp. H11S7]|uniref:Uncharacterized protein n=1 Tax=Scandinavium hiltneri TaxID=2926519 RepID=A0ABT2DVH1_9ENTR|nr:hypothetical protein [Scandinavium hiltneri]MCS2159618.1 hypothetical protein [Scandinavium hiltneri]
MEHRNVEVKLELTPEQAEALAQLAKRITWTDCRCNAESHDEAYLMMDAISRVQTALAEAGYAPR